MKPTYEIVVKREGKTKAEYEVLERSKKRQTISEARKMVSDSAHTQVDEGTPSPLVKVDVRVVERYTNTRGKPVVSRTTIYQARWSKREKRVIGEEL